MKLKRLFHVIVLMAVAATGFVGFSGAATASESAVQARPPFQLPVPCGQRWTTSTHGGHASQYMIDMVSAGGATKGTPALASAGGTVSVSGFFSDAGNMIVINHNDGWQTRYLHLDRRDVPVGAVVAQGQQIGTVGNTGSNTTGAHLHYEQKLNGVVQQAVINGNLVPVVWSYNRHFETSANCGSNPPPDKQWVDTFADAPTYTNPGVGSPTGKLYKGTNYVFCRAWGPEVRVGASYNHWWLKTDPDEGAANQWVSAYYLSRWGNDEAKDNSGVNIKDCA